MQTKWIWGLALLNVFLLVGLVTHWMPSLAEAQMRGTGGGGARPGDYVMIPGEIQGGSGGSVVYIIDQNTGSLTYVQYTGQANTPVGVAAAPLDLNRELNHH